MAESTTDQIIKEIPGFIRVYKDGRFLKLTGTDVVAPGLDLSTNVQSKDVVVSHDTPLSVRLYVPMNANPNVKKLPLLIYYHGGGFVVETASSPTYQNFLNLVASESNVVIVSVDYRTAPQYPVPACFQDSWDAIMWAMQHVDGNGPESWLNEYADFGNVFMAGDSAGANIIHHMAIRIGSEEPDRVVNLRGIMLLNPFFWGKDRMKSEEEHPWQSVLGDLWMLAHPETSGFDDPLINPDKDPKVSDLKCPRVLVCVAGIDILKDRGLYYKDILAKNGWIGEIEVVEHKGEDHLFFLFKPTSENAINLRKRISTFINHANGN
uniref:probable carboxylesterase 12 n=1 Tax=Erigeron canadensis TaxID=72917 RepID=UPI001CB8A43F|nr:probable carboxylesterase 12 [Erigeron canadensis]